MKVFGVRRVLLLALTTLGLAAGTAHAYPNPGIVAGQTITHDPSMLIRPSAPRYVVFATGGLTTVSNDRIDFAPGGPIFPTKPAWWTQNSLSGNMWAPDASFHNGKYWLYYAVSQAVGSQHSSIGLATSTTGLAGTWTDHGPIITSHVGDAYNAIDPNLLVDASGKWWLVFGSFWGGIYITPLNASTGKPTTSPPTVTNIARRGGSDAIEGAVVFHHGGYYYLFASFDYCCKTPASLSNYSVHVGRSTSPTGPYTDAAGTSMLSGGGTLMLGAHDYARAPGGQSVVYDSNGVGHDMLIYHYLDSRLQYKSFLGINYMAWNASGWPYLY